MSPSDAGFAAWVAQAIAFLLAIGLVRLRRRPQHEPFAIWIAVVLVADLTRQAVMIRNPWIVGDGPFDGPERVLFHLDQALLLTEPVGLVAVSWRLFLGRRGRWPILVGVALFALLVVGYPIPFRGPALGYAYATIQVVAVLASIVAMAFWTRRRIRPGPEHICLLFATGLTCALFAGPYAPPQPTPFADWSGAEMVYLGLWAALSLVQAFAIVGGFSTPRRRDG